MTTFDQFAVTDGSVTADPADGSAPVTFDAALVDRHDDGTAGWEPLVADWLDAGDGSISFDADGSAALSSDRVLSATEASSAVAVGDRRGAEAVLAYLAHEGGVGVDARLGHRPPTVRGGRRDAHGGVQQLGGDGRRPR